VFHIVKKILVRVNTVRFKVIPQIESSLFQTVINFSHGHHLFIKYLEYREEPLTVIRL